MDVLRRIDDEEEEKQEDQGTCDTIVQTPKTRTIEIEFVRVWRVLPVPYYQCDPLVIHE